MNNYDIEAAKRFGSTEAYAEYSRKTAGCSKEKYEQLIEQLNAIFAKFAEYNAQGNPADSDKVQTTVTELQNFITNNFYTCTDDILKSLGVMYIADERFKENIDKHGEGTADFISKAIKRYCE